MKDYFEIKNYEDAISSAAAVIRGDKYRITILSDILVRIEYSSSNKFEDRPTELVKFRKFDVPKFSIMDFIPLCPPLEPDFLILRLPSGKSISSYIIKILSTSML